MRLALLTSIAMLAFAANSILNRLGVAGAGMDPMAFAAVRVLAGAAMLWLLLRLRRPGTVSEPKGRLAGVIGLSAYLIGFSLAYVGLQAGLGALILFGCVQITMFAGALWSAEPVPTRRWIGAGLAFAGLAFLLSPGVGAPSLPHAALMAIAGLGWGIYSLAGRGQADALAATAANFLATAPVVLLIAGALHLLGPGLAMPPEGVALAILSGAVTSGLGYALWYSVLPGLGASRAAVAQLSVPVITALIGTALLGEAISLRFAVCALLVLGGVALALLRPKGAA
jgi:drug/metabolite transporter (DMT)-like permease